MGYLLHDNYCDTAEEALAAFGLNRTSESSTKFQGVESPSQERMVKYFGQLVKVHKGVMPTRRLRITSMVQTTLPAPVKADPTQFWFAITNGSENKPYYVSAGSVDYSKFGRCNRVEIGQPDHIPTDTEIQQLEAEEEGGTELASPQSPRSVFDGSKTPCGNVRSDVSPAGVATDYVDFYVQDIPILSGNCVIYWYFPLRPKGQHDLFHAWFHTAFVDPVEGAPGRCRLVLPRAGLDGPHKNKPKKDGTKVFEDDFEVVIEFEVV
eukprot:NODE_212_length_1419_cov_10547.165693_g114_i0.p1 GENE.NODE_212_length_1419_cov_10547.165693_g114_i0~~NODE_212_length_1419_cov_10547.165693_g114_i0.p1  ORF type:complete len:265 (+),score=94.74 NODE_212_length_1419_cov_10547.165693_g114_i0:32-826(+)